MAELADGDGGFVEDGGKVGFEFLPGCDAARLAELIEGLRECDVPALGASLGRALLLQFSGCRCPCWHLDHFGH